MWKVKISLYEEWFYMWIQANTVEAVGYGDLLIDGVRQIKTQGCVEVVGRED